MTDRPADSLPFAADEGTPAEQRTGEYVVVARRYRPQTFDELIGQEHVAQALRGAITSQRVGHAYLFTGARGVGKTSAARILAKALNCEQGPTPDPCNRCDSCLRIAAGDDVDVLEIDGASNRGIEEMRELRHNVGIRPSRSRFKIYIIDEVHMLTREAFNALLKTLEEPPEHVKFIFCTTEPEKIPVTILSRCQRFDFAGLSMAAILERLRQIVAAEGAEADPEALAILARAAGSMRDSQSLLEQLLATAGGNARAADVHRMLGTAADDRLAALADGIVSGDSAAALAELDRAAEEGVDPGQLVEQLLGYCRDLMVVAVGMSAEGLRYVQPADFDKLSDSVRQLGLGRILAVMQILDETLARMRYSSMGRVLAELAIVRAAKLEDFEQLPALVARLSGESDGPPKSEPRSRTAESAPKKNGAETVTSIAAPAASAPAATQSSDPSVLRLTAGTADQVWRAALARLADLTADQASCYDRVATSAPNHLVVRFPAKYTSCKAFCERPDQATRLEAALAEVTGTPVRLEFTLGDEPVATADLAPTEQRRSNWQLLRQKSEEPFVVRAAELFDARPVRIERSTRS